LGLILTDSSEKNREGGEVNGSFFVKFMLIFGFLEEWGDIQGNSF